MWPCPIPGDSDGATSRRTALSGAHQGECHDTRLPQRSRGDHERGGWMRRGGRNSIKDIWGKRTPHEGEWPVRADERLVEEPDEWVQSCCVLCSNGCALDIGVKGGRIVGVR